jgi:hypothetical protein
VPPEVTHHLPERGNPRFLAGAVVHQREHCHAVAVT